MKTIYLLRHGEVEDAYKDRTRGSGTDCLLSPAGKRMSLINARFLVLNRVQRVITSGMKRSDYLGKYLSRHYGINHEIDTDFRELGLNEWEGRLFDDIKKAHPEASAKFMANPLSGAFPGMEDPVECERRVLAAWERALEADIQEQAIVAHGVINTVILRAIAKLREFPLLQEIGCMNEIVVEPPPKLVRTNVLLYTPEMLS